jgi:hypothetical protein
MNFLQTVLLALLANPLVFQRHGSSAWADLQLRETRIVANNSIPDKQRMLRSQRPY